MLKSEDAMFAIVQKGAIHLWDWRATKTEASYEAWRLTKTKGEPFEVEDIDEFSARVTRHWLNQFPLCEVTDDFYNQMLEVLPPIQRAGVMGFLMSEFTAGSVTTQFVQFNGRCFGAHVDVTDRSTFITPHKIIALPPAEPLKWFPPKADEVQS